MASVFFILGIIWGSFFNVVIYRLPLEKTIVSGRSSCPSCGYVLKPLDLIPIFSILFLGFKCRNCKAPISPRYLLVELLTGLGWLVSYLLSPNDIWLAVSGCILVSLCIIVSFIDYDTHYISDSVLLIFGLGQVIVLLLSGNFDWKRIVSAFAGALLYGMIYIIAKWAYGHEAFGMGDIFYIFTLGIWFSILDIVIVAFGAFFVATILLIGSALQRKITRHKEIPFAPAMSIMAIIMFFFGTNLKEIYMNWMFR